MIEMKAIFDFIPRRRNPGLTQNYNFLKNAVEEAQEEIADKMLDSARKMKPVQTEDEATFLLIPTMIHPRLEGIIRGWDLKEIDSEVDRICKKMEYENMLAKDQCRAALINQFEFLLDLLKDTRTILKWDFPESVYESEMHQSLDENLTDSFKLNLHFKFKRIIPIMKLSDFYDEDEEDYDEDDDIPNCPTEFMTGETGIKVGYEDDYGN